MALKRILWDFGVVCLNAPKDAAKKLTGAKRRAFQAQVAIDYVNSKAYLAEKTFGWDRNIVTLGLNEHRTGIVCVDNFKGSEVQRYEKLR